MRPILVQIYEVQEPQEAGPLIELGVDHIGCVIQSPGDLRQPLLRESVRLVNESPSRSSLIPLLTDPDEILGVVAYYEPALVHFCDDIPLAGDDEVQKACEGIRRLHERIRREFPGIGIIRSLPVPEAVPPGAGRAVHAVLRLASLLEASCDFFMTDTLLGWAPGKPAGPQPEEGFVGITGRCCDWEIAAALCRQTKIPVILAGGISPDNVREAILAVRPAGVDSCTHTNRTDPQGLPIRFRKDLARVRRLIEEVRQAESLLQKGSGKGGS